MQITQRLSALSASPTAQVKRVADQLKRDGVRVFDFGVGEPDFPTPEAIKAAAKSALDKNYTTYTAARGILELRQAVADKYNEDYKTNLDPEHVVISVGAKQALYNLMLALVDPGDEVLIPAPYWVTYPAQVQLAGGRCVVAPLKEANAFKLTVEDIQAHLSDKTKVICLNSPCNPTGAVIEENELKKITTLAAERNIALIYDECYEKFIFGTAHANPLQWNQDNVIVVGSASKTYAMTGWRIGWAIGPKDVIAATDRLQSQSTSNPTSIAQWAAVEALQGDQAPVQAMLDEYTARRTLVLERLGQIPNLTCATPQGAFYVFPNVSAFFNDDMPDSVAFAKTLLETAHVAVVPGSAFGMEGYVRLSYAAPEETLKEGLSRIAKALN